MRASSAGAVTPPKVETTYVSAAPSARPRAAKPTLSGRQAPTEDVYRPAASRSKESAVYARHGSENRSPSPRADALIALELLDVSVEFAVTRLQLQRLIEYARAAL